MKKVLSLFLSIMMLISVMAGMSVTAQAIGQYGVDLNSAGYNSQNAYKNRPQCTWYCWGRAYEKLGVSLPKWGNAISWDDNADADPNYTVGTVARANSIMVENDTSGDGHGHVMFVEKVENGYAYITEGNWLSSDYNEDRINLSTMVRDKWQGHTLAPVRYIYLTGGSINPIIHDNKNYVTVGENITFWYSGLTECSKAEFYFEKGGTLYYTKDSTASREFSTYFENEGIYHVYCGGYFNGQWYYSDRITVYVFNPKLSSNKSSVIPNEEITFNYSGLTNCESVAICFEKNGKVYWTVDSTKTRTHKNSFTNPGEYYVYAKGTINDYSTISNKIKINVKCENHTWNSGVTTKKTTCTTTGTKLYTCSVCGETKTETIKAKGHTTAIDKEIPATCEIDGKTEGKHCSVCGEILVAQKTVKATGHKAVTVKGTPATFTAAGKTDGKKCSVCGKILTAQKTIAKLGSPSLSKVTAGSKQFKATWKSVSGIEGYQIQYSTSSNFKSGNKTVTVSGYKSTSKTVKSLKAKKKYYVRIRAYKYINGKKYYSAWSKSRSVTTKK